MQAARETPGGENLACVRIAEKPLIVSYLRLSTSCDSTDVSPMAASPRASTAQAHRVAGDGQGAGRLGWASGYWDLRVEASKVVGADKHSNTAQPNERSTFNFQRSTMGLSVESRTLSVVRSPY